MKITIIYNRVESLTFGKPEDILADEDTIKTAKAIFSALKSLGYKCDLWEINEKNAKDIFQIKTDFFFNQAFGIDSLPKTESSVIEFLEKTGIPFSGSGSKATSLTTDKFLTKQLLKAHNLPTPKFQLFLTGKEILDPSLNFPLIVKPAGEDCSLGIDKGAVQTDSIGLYKKVREVHKNYSEPILVEEYIEGRELNVTLLGNGKAADVLPIPEIFFGRSFTGRYKILDFASKWEEETDEYKDTLERKCPADLPLNVQLEVERVARGAFVLTDCSGYGRVDIRLSKNNIPYVLEVNTNPAIGPKDGTVRTAADAGMTYNQLLEKIIEAGLEKFRTYSRKGMPRQPLAAKIASF